MIGAIIGDIVGSVYEWNNIKTKEFPLFRDDCFFTDDTVMTCAVAEAVMNGGKRDDFIDAMKKYGRMYPDAGDGLRFLRRNGNVAFQRQSRSAAVRRGHTQPPGRRQRRNGNSGCNLHVPLLLRRLLWRLRAAHQR